MVLNSSIASCLNDDESIEYMTTHRDEESNIVYLNNAAQARLSKSCEQVGVEAIGRHPWESQHDIADDAQAQVRQLFAQMIQTESSNIAIHPSTAFAVTMAAENIHRLHRAMSQSAKPKNKILVMEDEFNSAVYPWQRVIQRSQGQLEISIVPYPDEAMEDSWTDAILRQLDESVLATCLTPLHWSNGAILDLQRISQRCKEANAYLIVDSTQATGIYPCSIRNIQPDMLCCSVHKWLRGPSGASLVYIDPKLHNTWEPLDQHGRGRASPDGESWDCRQHSMTEDGYPTTFFADARKFDAGGKANPILLPMLAVALNEVATLDIEKAQEQLKMILQPLMEWSALHQYTFAREHCHHLIGLRPRHLTLDQMLDVAATLAQDESIFIAVKCGAFRISPYLDTTTFDILKLIDALIRHGGLP
ncbi:hypothetical protein MPSEU_000504100 [Mayamaea pseudoterrestris]|nr:hypothetical protein MPSEU_000504100 [Mayamaea pseudoterrestris]